MEIIKDIFLFIFSVNSKKDYIPSHMSKKIFHGNFTPDDLASLIHLHFDRSDLEVRKLGSLDQIVVQIRTRTTDQPGGTTAIGITFQSFEDGVIISVGKQDWAGIAASLGYSALAALRNPFSLLGRLDDIAQDIAYLSLEEEIWRVLESNVRIKGNKYDLSDRLRRMTCAYCDTANSIDTPHCMACGAPMGDNQPKTCKNCGYILIRGETVCPNCKKRA